MLEEYTAPNEEENEELENMFAEFELEVQEDDAK
jgi:hypothetical protein